MKKIINLFLIIVIFITNINLKTKAKNEYIEPKNMSDTIILLLTSNIKEEIIKYYGYDRSFGFYNIQLKSITQKVDNKLDVEIIVLTYEHAHNPPYGRETMSFEVSSNGVKTNYFYHETDEFEILREKFYSEVIKDVEKTFEMDFSKYNKLIRNKIYYRKDFNDTYKSLNNILNDIITKDNKPVIKEGYKNVIDPLTFILDNDGYIIFKKTDGTNVVYEIKLNDGIWNVVKKAERKGKVMKYLLNWYM